LIVPDALASTAAKGNVNRLLARSAATHATTFHIACRLSFCLCETRVVRSNAGSAAINHILLQFAKIQ
jgi:hypothetical protein